MQTKTCMEPQIIELEDVVSIIKGGKLRALSISQSKLNMLRLLCAPLRQQRI